MAGFPLEELKEKYRGWKSTPIEVKLISATQSPYDTSAASARTCYSSNGLLLPADMRKSEKSLETARRVAKSTLKSGHLTTRQHAHFIFGITGASRNVIWQVFHSHPYYNSEQVSQRYVPIKNDRSWYTLPPELAEHSEITSFFDNAHRDYEKLIELLEPRVSEIYFSIHRLKARQPDAHRTDIRKRCMEIARYVMPLGTNAYFYHTISALTLLRYAKMIEHFANPEAAAIILQMVELVLEIDPDFALELTEPLPERQLETDPIENHRRNAEFDKAMNGQYACFVSGPDSIDSILDLAEAALGYRPELADLLDSARNSLPGETLYPVSMDELSRTLNHLHFTFQKKLSHTADSQEQRHRTLPGLRPDLATTLVVKPDYIVPALLREVPAAGEYFQESMHKTFSLLEKLYERGISARNLTYLLPNAYPIRFVESGDLLNFYHKWKARLCYNAQEEIFYSALDEVRSLQSRYPELYELLGPPCKVRSHLKPRCPEGDHFCGIKVWQIPMQEYNRIL